MLASVFFFFENLPGQFLPVAPVYFISGAGCVAFGQRLQDKCIPGNYSVNLIVVEQTVLSQGNNVTRNNNGRSDALCLSGAL